MKFLKKKTSNKREEFKRGLLDLSSKGLITVLLDTPLFTKIETRNTTCFLSFDPKNGPYYLNGHSLDADGLEKYLENMSEKKDLFDRVLKNLEKEGHIQIQHATKEFAHVVKKKGEKHITVWFTPNGKLFSVDGKPYSIDKIKELLAS